MDRLLFQLFRRSAASKSCGGLYQQDSRTDLLLRRLEHEAVGRLQEHYHGFSNLADDIQSSLSRYWMLSMYEVLRRAHETENGRENTKLRTLRNRIEIVRVPIAKHQIANDGKIGPTSPIQLARVGSGPEDVVSYSSAQRVTYLPLTMICTATGSYTWSVVNARTRTQEVISRRAISDECLGLFDLPEAACVT